MSATPTIGYPVVQTLVEPAPFGGINPGRTASKTVELAAFWKSTTGRVYARNLSPLTPGEFLITPNYPYKDSDGRVRTRTHWAGPYYDDNTLVYPDNVRKGNCWKDGKELYRGSVLAGSTASTLLVDFGFTVSHMDQFRDYKIRMDTGDLQGQTAHVNAQYSIDNGDGTHTTQLLVSSGLSAAPAVGDIVAIMRVLTNRIRGRLPVRDLEEAPIGDAAWSIHDDRPFTVPKYLKVRFYPYFANEFFQGISSRTAWDPLSATSYCRNSLDAAILPEAFFAPLWAQDFWLELSHIPDGASWQYWYAFSGVNRAFGFFTPYNYVQVGENTTLGVTWYLDTVELRLHGGRLSGGSTRAFNDLPYPIYTPPPVHGHQGIALVLEAILKWSAIDANGRVYGDPDYYPTGSGWQPHQIIVTFGYSTYEWVGPWASDQLQLQPHMDVANSASFYYPVYDYADPQTWPPGFAEYMSVCNPMLQYGDLVRMSAGAGESYEMPHYFLRAVVE